MWKSWAHQLMKQRFNKIANDLSGYKPFFFAFVKRPQLMTPDGILLLALELEQIKNSPEYAKIAQASSEKTETLKNLKRERDNLRSKFRRGQREFERNPKSTLGAEWASGNLEKRLRKAEEDFGNRRTSGVAVLMKC